MDSPDVLAANVRRLRTWRGLSITDLAAKAGIPREEISRLENGHATNPTRDRIEALASALGVAPGRLLDS